MVEGKVLIAGIRTTTGKTLENILNAKGLVVEATDLGREVVEKARTGTFNIVIVENQLPDMDWMSLVHELKKVNPAVDCIIIAEHGSVQQGIQAVEEGAGGYFIEPIVVEEVSNRVHELLEKQRLARELRAAEKALRENEAKYDNLFNHANTAIIIHDLDGHILDMNERALELFGYQKDETASITMEELHPTDEFAQAKTACESVGRGGFIRFGIDFQRKDGRIFSAEVLSTLIEMRGKKAVQTIVRDISDNRVLEIPNDRLAIAIEQAGEAIVITDAQGTIQYVNPAFEKNSGYSRKEAIGQNPKILSSGRQNKVFYRNLWTTIQRGDIWQGHIINRRKDGEFFEEEATISPVHDQFGTIIHYVAVMRDVTRQRALEEQLLLSQKMEAVGTLAGGIAHDFNNILTAIGGYADRSMSKVDPSDPLYSDLKIIYDASIRGTDLTRQLLIYGRKQPMELIVLNVNAVIHDLLKMLGRVIGEDVSIISNLYPNLWNLKADKGNIEQVIMNLSINARDAMPDGGKLIIKTKNIHLDENFCRFIPRLSPGKYICLTVQDTGMGMDEDILEHVFEPFYSTKGPGKGTGLGLSVVYGIVDQHMGHIDLKSEPGKGTKFKIYLPAYCEDTDVEGKKCGSLDDIQGSGEKVLLVEDDQQVRKFTSTILGENGYRVVSAQNTEEAWELFERENRAFDIVFSDVVLPGKSGLQLVDKLLSCKPELGVVMFSGYTDEKSQWRIIRERGYKFLNKPVFAKDILKAIKEVTEKKTT